MGDLIDGDDGLPAEEVGAWAAEKHGLLCRYVHISHATRTKYIGPGNGGAAYIDPFCGPGRARIRETGEWIDGGCVAAWKESVRTNSRFSKVYIGDLDEGRLKAAGERLRRLGAPVTEFHGPAKDTAQQMVEDLHRGYRSGLHFAFLDPFSLGALDFRIIECLATLRRMDMMIHVSKMDLQRNLAANLTEESSDFDVFAPGWRDKVNANQSQTKIRVEVVNFWRTLVGKQGTIPSPTMQLITGSKNQPLYWLLLAARHELAHKFWKSTTKSDQGDLFP